MIKHEHGAFYFVKKKGSDTIVAAQYGAVRDKFFIKDFNGKIASGIDPSELEVITKIKK